jgi:hypothetical protein
MIRAEVVIQNEQGAVRDFRIDRGQITAAGPGFLTLREDDGTVVTIQVGANARIVGLGRAADASRLRPPMRVLVVRQANKPANMVQVENRG